MCDPAFFFNGNKFVFKPKFPARDQYPGGITELITNISINISIVAANREKLCIWNWGNGRTRYFTDKR